MTQNLPNLHPVLLEQITESKKDGNVILSSLYEKISGSYIKYEKETAALKELSDAALSKLEEKNRNLSEELKRVENAGLAKSAFLANMSHELRTPLNAVIGICELLLEEMQEEGNDTYKEPLHRIENAGRHLLNLISDILDISKIEAGKMDIFVEEFSIVDIMQEIKNIASNAAEKNHNKLELDIAENLGNMATDITKLKQILINFIGNGCKFTQNGTISLNVRSDMRAEGDNLIFTVRDTGIGMTQSQVDKLFDNFVQAEASTTRKFGGTGLGLAISKRMAEMLGGAVSVISEKDKGTSITLTLPRTPKSSPGSLIQDATKQINTVVKEAGEELKVLIIDDDQVVRDLMYSYLKNSPYKVTFASTGQDGLDAARNTRPDVVILDIMLPDIPGWEVLSTIKKESEMHDTNIIMMSITEEKNRGYMMGASDYLVKPFDQKTLLRSLSRYIDAEDTSKNTGRCILIIDDDADARLILRSAIAKFNARVIEAQDGLEALEILKTEKPDLIMLDLMMPRMNGFEVVDYLYNNPELAKIPLIINTSKDLTTEDYSRLRGAMSNIISKNEITKDKIIEKICLMLENVKETKNKKNSQ